jgi:hypothetical protein
MTPHQIISEISCETGIPVAHAAFAAAYLVALLAITAWLFKNRP